MLITEKFLPVTIATFPLNNPGLNTDIVRNSNLYCADVLFNVERYEGEPDLVTVTTVYNIS